MRTHSKRSVYVNCSVFAALLLSLTARAETFNWPQWQGPTRNSLTQETGLLQEWPEGGPKQRWLFEDCGAGYAGPAIVNGTLYILGERDGACQLIAINADTGKELWATAIGPEFQNDWGGGPRNTPTVDDSTIDFDPS